MCENRLIRLFSLPAKVDMRTIWQQNDLNSAVNNAAAA